ncbi:hypothetical protein GU3_08750 [Oceanimonas sp. GK1]|nr:hypothetical protein GU3_08750 [Oceanimonas sp. GK1]
MGAIPLANGAVKYKVDEARFNDFFTALSCGIVFKACKAPLPKNYKISHIYHNFVGQTDPQVKLIESEIDNFYSGQPIDVMAFGEPGTKNERIYTATIFGVPHYQSSITVVHVFFGKFKVTSMLTRKLMA